MEPILQGIPFPVRRCILPAPWGILSVLLLLAGLAGGARAEEGAGTLGPLHGGLGARSIAMGRSGVADARGALALFWNPARLSDLDRADLSAYRTRLFTEDAIHRGVYAAWPTLSLGTLAIGVQRLGVDGIERRDERNFPLGDFSSGETHVLVGAGRRFGRSLSLGAALRFQQQSMDESSDLAFGLDLGLAHERPLDRDGRHRLRGGLNLQNLVAPALRLEDVSVEDPRILRAGVGYAGAGERVGWALDVGVDLPERSDTRLALGAEIHLDRTIFLRAGSDGGRPTFGFGLESHGLRFDYALLDDPDLGRNDHFSLGVAFGPGVAERRAEQAERRRDEVRQEMDRLLRRQEEETHRRARAEADLAHQAGDWARAAELYRRVEVLAPGDEEAARRRDEAERELALAEAAASLQAGELPRAALLYQECADRWPADARAVSGLQTVRDRLERAQDRRRQVDELFRLALERFSDGDFLAARSTLDEILRIQPDHGMARELRERSEAMRRQTGEELLGRARELAARGRREEALSALGRVSSLLPEDESRWEELRRDWSAVPEPAVAVAEAPTAPAPLGEKERQKLQERFQDGLARFQARDFQGATEQWEAVWQRDPRFEEVDRYLVKAYLLQGVDLYGQGRYAAALDRCQRVLRIDPRNEKARRYLARIEEERQEIQELRGD